MKNKRWATLVVVAISATAAALATRSLLAAGIPTTGGLTYSGTLEDAAGTPLTGTHTIDVYFWNTPAAGATPLCQTQGNAVSLIGGRFSLPLPDTCAAAVQGNKDIWAEVRVEATSLGLSKLGSVPFSIEAGHATSSDSATVAAGAAGALEARLKAMVPPKTVITAYLDAADISSSFDATGLGKTGGAYAGWAICNGNNQTPNLNGRFVRINQAGAGALGGSDTIAAHTHAIDHDHPSFTSAAEAAHTHATPDHHHLLPMGFDSNVAFFVSDTGGIPIFGSTVMVHNHAPLPIPAVVNGPSRLGVTDTSGAGVSGPGAAHSHAVDPPPFTGTSGAAAASDNRPAYLELVALMRL
jgi:hypothetical protein